MTKSYAFLIIIFVLIYILSACDSPSLNGSSDSSVKTYKVIYAAPDADSGSVPSDSNTYRSNDIVTVMPNSGSLQRSGLFFIGWSTISTATVVDYLIGDTFSIGASDITLYAVWTANPVFTVTYSALDSESGNVPVDLNNYQEGDEVIVKGNTEGLERSGYGFVGWSETSGATSADYLAGSDFNIGDENVVLHAVWDEIITANMIPIPVPDIPGGITFPMGIDDDTYGTISTPYLLAQTEITLFLAREILQWAYDNGKITDVRDAHNEVNVIEVYYGFKLLTRQAHSNEVESLEIHFNDGHFGYNAPFMTEYPFLGLSWYGAIMFCNWMTEMEDGNTDNIVYQWVDDGDGEGTAADGIWDEDETDIDLTKTGYRLPTAEEWEYAARYIGTTEPSGGDLEYQYVFETTRYSGSLPLTTGYYWTPGDYASGALADYENQTASYAVAVYPSSPSDTEYLRPEPVASKQSNILGLYDMSGNVWEWTSTQGVSDARIIYGGNWENHRNNIRIGQQVNFLASNYYQIGLRFCKNAE